MALMINDDKTDLIVNCNCGCDNSVHIRIEPDDGFEEYCYLSILNSNFYRDQNMSLIAVIKTKLKKIWAVIRNKDYYYAEICMTVKDYEIFKQYINQFGGNENE